MIRLKIQSFLCKNAMNNNTLMKQYLGITLIQKRYKRASTKIFCHALVGFGHKGVGGLSESVKKGKIVMKIFFSDNFE